jgi:hypothetical protein
MCKEEKGVNFTNTKKSLETLSSIKYLAIKEKLNEWFDFAYQD